MRVSLRVSLLGATLALAGCPTPPPGKPSPLPPASAPSTQPASGKAGGKARVHLLGAGEELGGTNVTGKQGDWMIENDEVVFVIDALGGGAGFAESGGNLIDAADAKARKDELGQLFTYFGAFPRQAVYDKLDARSEPDGTAILEARGKELYEPTLAIVTQYRLAPGDRALLVRTTLKNVGSAKIGGLVLGDAIQWGATEKLAPGKPVGFKGRSEGPFIGAVGRLASYAITSTEGRIGGVSGSSWTDTEQKKDVELAPGASATYERVFVVGERPDVASIVAELTRSAGGDVGAVAIGLTDAKGAKVNVPPGAKVVLGTEKTPEILSIVATKDGDVFGGELPPGDWLVAFAPSVGRRGAGKPVKVTVTKGGVTRVSLSVTDAAAFPLGPCVEADGKETKRPVPCKLTIEGKAGTPTPDLGPPNVAGLAKDVVTLRPNETMTVPLPLGKYRVTSSRGPEYDVTAVDFEVPGPAVPAFVLKRVVETPGYVAGDFHQHSILSADAPVSTRDRVLANAAEGVEIAVASEHNAVADLMPIVKELGLGAFLVEIAGDELTSDASKKPFGHANVYPIAPQPDKPRNGAPAVRDRLATEVFAESLQLPGGPHVLQINHPRSGPNGYFDQLGFDPKTGVGTGAGYEATFDAIEVWNGRVIAHRTGILDDYMALLRTSHPATPMADTDTHGVVGEEPGYPRTYVRVGSDTGLDAWDPARSKDLVRAIREVRDVVCTNGPFLKVSANGAPIGGVVKGGGPVTVKVTVTSAPWVEVNRVELKLAKGKPPAPVTLTQKKNAAGALVGEATFTITTREDDAFVVRAFGTKAMRPVLGGTDDAEIAPYAMSGPIWIDTDGDGKSLGRVLPK